ncbi:cyclin-J-like [Clavelina lepadiformis]|uniref:cyclin-J-like n=1 Tax=Clavelina lepadiformis TaxID=159417 RepID=UPI00404244CA
MDCEWWDWNDLAKDIHDTLKSRENLLLRLKGGSKLMYWRRYLVDWLALTCQKYRLNSNAQHLAVCLYDRYTDKYEIAVDELQMLVLCCLLVASKFEEREEKIPKFKVLLDHLQWSLNASEYLNMEIKLLSAFEWHIGFPTASHFKEYYMQYALGARDLHAGRQLVNREQAYVYLEKNVNYFLEVSLQDQAFLVFKPSLVMSSCLAAARICLHISPTWTVDLQQVTMFSWNHLVPCIEVLLRLHDDDRKAMQNNFKNSTSTGNLGVHSQHELDSTGSTPVASPGPHPTFPNEMHRNATIPLIVPPHRYNRGYLV